MKRSKHRGHKEDKNGGNVSVAKMDERGIGQRSKEILTGITNSLV